MIKDIKLKPFTHSNPLPAYTRWKGMDVYTLKATVINGYEITLAVLTIGKSFSNQNVLSHVLFESFDDHGRKMFESRMRTSGYEHEFMAITGAMVAAGITFEALAPSCRTEDIMKEIGDWYKAHNPEISEVKIVLQKLD